MNRIILRGVPVSEGVAIGLVAIYGRPGASNDIYGVRGFNAAKELKRLECAVNMALAEINRMSDSMETRFGKDERGIIDVYGLILQDDIFLKEIRDAITNCRVHADEAAAGCFDNYIKHLEASDDPYLRQRVSDLNDIKSKILTNLRGCTTEEINFAGRIIAVKELTTSFALALCRRGVIGVAAQRGAGYSSHAAIILRSRGIPLLDGLRFDELIEYDNRLSIIDGNAGLMIIEPDEVELEEYRVLSIESPTAQRAVQESVLAPVATSDGCRIRLYAGIGSLKEYQAAVKLGLDGIGLVRTENLFLSRDELPEQELQTYIYSRIAAGMYPKRVVIRAADLRGEMPSTSACSMNKRETTSNRGIQYLLANRNLMAVQIRSVLMASKHGNIDLAFPVVNSGEEMEEAEHLVRHVREMLNIGQHDSVSMPGTGAFIESQEAVRRLDDVLKEADFICIGTNDLLQDVTGLDRAVSTGGRHLYLNLEFLKLLKLCIDKADQYGKPLSICGEMVSEPAAVVLLIGMGVTGLCTSPLYAEQVAKVISRTSMKAAREFAANAMESFSTDDIILLFMELMGDRM